ncbi:MAG: hypothetical protein ACAH83_02300 [Alphaproteobacteria bacterium]
MISLQKKFVIGDRVIVNKEGGWKRNCLGTICGGPEDVKILQGSEYYYWVKFDEPEQDINGPHEYSKAQILSQYIDAL